MMFQADKAYSRLVSDGQKVFALMKQEYDDILERCKELAKTVSAQ